MSGIFGFINQDGRSPSHEHFGAMADEMVKWGSDGVNKVLKDLAAFGHALLIVTHESRFEKMPYYNDNEDLLFTAAARLDNRDELCDIFNFPLAERPIIPDGQIVFHAYRKWGADSCKHIFGDWSFAAWHGKEQRLFLARDHIGNTGLFYYFKPPLIVFASNPEAILAHPEVPRELDELQLAKNLGIEIEDKDWSRTYWKDIFSLPSAHTMTLSVRNRQIDNYWSLNEVSPVRLGSDSNYLEGFLEHIRRAVKARLNSIRPIGSQLSAGLDSSAVTALAAQELQKENRSLATYTSVPLHSSNKLFPNSLTDEWPLASKVAELYNNIEHLPIRADDITPLAAIKRSLEITHTPQHAAGNMTWIISLFEHARQRNLGVMLTGQLGNGGVSWSGGRDYIFYLFANNQWRKGLQALTAWKKQQGFSWFRAVKNQILRPLLLPLWSEYQLFLHPLTYSFPQKAFIRQLGLNKSARKIFKTKRIEPLTERILTIIRNGSFVGPIWHSFGAYYNMEVRDPTADVRLLEFCMGIPDEQDTFAGGQRMMIRRSMNGILPDAVRWNTIRGKQAADVIFRIRDQRADVEQQLTDFQSAAEVTRYIDTAAMKNAWDTWGSSSSSSTHSFIHAFLRAFNTAYFLRAIAGGKEKILHDKSNDERNS